MIELLFTRGVCTKQQLSYQTFKSVSKVSICSLGFNINLNLRVRYRLKVKV